MQKVRDAEEAERERCRESSADTQALGLFNCWVKREEFNTLIQIQVG